MEVEGRTDNTTVVAGDNLCPSKTPRGPGDEETRSRWWHHTATDIDSPSPGLLHTLIQLLLNTRIHKWFCLCLGTRLMETQSALIGRTHAAGQVFTEFSMTSEFKKNKQPNLYLTSKSPSSVTHSMTQQLSLAQNDCGEKVQFNLANKALQHESETTGQGQVQWSISPLVLFVQRRRELMENRTRSGNEWLCPNVLRLFNF